MKEERIEKPWGYEIIWAKTDDYVGKILHINPHEKLSLQYHEKKEETIMVKSGLMGLVLVKNHGTVDEKRLVHQLTEGDTFHIYPGVVHRYMSLGEHVDIIEVSTTELDDVVRLEDEYERV